MKRTKNNKIGKMNEEINLNDIILKWVVFWGTIIIGSVLLACAILIPLEYENEKLILEYNLISNQLKLLKQANKTIKLQAKALGKDPQFTENIVREELNIRKPGVETIKVNPVPIKKYHYHNDFPTHPSSSRLFILNHADNWYIKPFLELHSRLWIFALSVGLILVGIITAK